MWHLIPKLHSMNQGGGDQEFQCKIPQENNADIYLCAREQSIHI